jgi:ubiquinone/menaquinone biosynthesis C-methylase UbiE
MGIYSKYVLPRIIDLAMRNKETTGLRAAWIPHARGDVLEVGIGSGLNLPFYSDDVRCVYGVDPSMELLRMARRKVLARPIRLEFFLQSAEDQLPVPDESVDTVVLTWTLCSIADAPRALQQIMRVLKNDGRLIFVEHGRSPDPKVARWQESITPVWKHVGGGCHLNRQIDELVRRAGFRIAELKTGYLPGPRAMSYTYQGFAEKDATRAPI